MCVYNLNFFFNISIQFWLGYYRKSSHRKGLRKYIHNIYTYLYILFLLYMHWASAVHLELNHLTVLWLATGIKVYFIEPGAPYIYVKVQPKTKTYTKNKKSSPTLRIYVKRKLLSFQIQTHNTIHKVYLNKKCFTWIYIFLYLNAMY